jgi:cytoskeletal protein CcmA (bactofilin family)
MDTATQVGIGPTIHIKGEVTAQEPLTIAGRLEGTVQVNGHPVTVSPGGCVTASITADTIVIGGSVNGRSEAGRRIIVHETAKVEGDLIAPAISFADGATVSGRVETAARAAATLPLAS